MSIRPVVKRFPSSLELWEETNLPLCITVTPVAEDTQQDPPPSGSNGGDDEAYDDDDDDAGVAEPLSSIPKCLHCGAPHPPSSVGLTHFRPAKSSVLFCFLCGKTSSTMFTDQYKARHLDEYLNVDTFDRIGSQLQRRQNQQRKGDAKSRRSGHEITPPPSKTVDSVDFRLPLEVVHHSVDDDHDDDTGGSGGGDADGDYEGDSSTKPPTITWQLPAMKCPPIWWIVIDGTVHGGSPQARQYYDTISTVLQETIQDAPSHVHIGLVTSTSSKICCWDLTSAVPHMEQYPYTYEGITSNGGGTSNKGLLGSSSSSQSSIDLCIVPVGGFQSNIQAALRAMNDAATSGAFLYDDDMDDDDDVSSEEDKKTNKSKSAKTAKSKKNGKTSSPFASSTSTSGIPLSLTLEVLLEFMSVGQHPGQDEVVEIELEDGDNTGSGGDGGLRSMDILSQIDQMKYAGGRILCLLGNTPSELAAPSNDSMSMVSQDPFYEGGVAGVCFAQDTEGRWDTAEQRQLDADSTSKSKNKSSKDDNETDPTDLTPENMKEYVVPLDPEHLFSTIGKRCALAAFGVDILVVVPEEEEENDDESYESPVSMIPWYGLPLLRVLADSSGAPGPLMFGSGQPDAIQQIGDHILARTPWQAGMIFGAKLRLRTSPGFDVEDSPVEEKRKTKLQLATMLSSGGIMGPAFVSDDPAADGGGFGSPDDTGLWVLGTCDPYTTLTVDLQPAKTIEDKYTVDGFGEVAMKPVIQTCLLYTCVETDDDDPDKYYTVCKMKVSSIAVPLANTVERLLDYLDPEAMAAVLYHKIALDAYLDGLVAAQETAEAWLRSLLLCVYQSAQLEQAKIEELSEEADGDNSTSDEDVNPNFVALDRLLDQDGDMEVEDVLLGQGHNKVAVLPLLVFALMQCDGLRPTGGSFQPSMDSRLCAISQMSSMPPSILSKSIAPSLSLWSLKDDTTIIESLPLSTRGILTALAELDMDVDNDEDSILFLDSPRRMMLYPVKALWENTGGQDKKKNNKKNSSSKQKSKTMQQEQQQTTSIRIKIGPNFEETIRSCLDGHRTAPTGWNDIEDLIDSEDQRSRKKEYEIPPFIAFDTAMIEDKPTWNGTAKDFAEWRIAIATIVQEELIKSGDLEA